MTGAGAGSGVPAGDRSVDRQQWWDDLSPRMRLLMTRVVVVTLVFGVATPAEWLVPVLRTAQDRRGVHLGPSIASLLAVAAALEGLGRGTGSGAGPEAGPAPEPGSSRPPASWRKVRSDAELIVAAAVPAAAALLPGLVVLPRRSPLWGWAVSAAGRLAVSAVVALDNDRRKRAEAA